MFAYESLEIWKISVKFAKNVYKITEKFPKNELFGLTSQLRRASVSISANIAEGSGSTSIKDKSNYLDISVKSALEVTSELQVAFELGYIQESDKTQLYDDAESIIRRIRSFKKFVQNHRL